MTPKDARAAAKTLGRPGFVRKVRGFSTVAPTPKDSLVNKTGHPDKT